MRTLCLTTRAGLWRQQIPNVGLPSFCLFSLAGARNRCLYFICTLRSTLNKTLDLLPLLDGGRNKRHCRALTRKSASVPLGPGDARVLSLVHDTKRLNYRYSVRALPMAGPFITFRTSITFLIQGGPYTAKVNLLCHARPLLSICARCPPGRPSDCMEDTSALPNSFPLEQRDNGESLHCSRSEEARA